MKNIIPPNYKINFKSFLILLLYFTSPFIIAQQASLPDCETIFSPEILNFDGEKNLSDLPLHFNYSDDYHPTLDTTVFHNGSRSLKVLGSNFTAKTFATTSIEIPFHIKKGANINLSVWVKTDSLRGDNGGAMLRIMGYTGKKTATPALFKFNEKIIKGSNDWTKICINTDLLQNINRIVLSGLMQGQGTVWFDQFEMEIDGVRLEDIDFSGLIGNSLIEKELSNYLQPFQPANYNIIDKEIKKSRLIGLGEATHGTKQIFEIKKNLIAYLVTNHNVRKIALEAYFQNTEELNIYIKTGKGDLREILANLEFWPYYTEEFYEFIDWIKEYNNTHFQKVSITGIDSQSATKSLDYLIKNLNNNHKFSQLLDQIKSDTTSIVKKLELSNNLLAAISASGLEENLKKNAQVLSQSYFLNQFTGLKYSNVRDSIMAINTANLVRDLPETEKAVLWAHDLHIQKKEGWTGGFLSKNLKEDYLNIGFLLGQGTFTALDKKNQKLNSNNELNTVSCNSIESLIAQTDYPVQLLDLKGSSQNLTLKSYLYNQNLQKRSIGALDNIMQFEFLGNGKEEIYNYLIFIKESEASTMLPMH